MMDAVRASQTSVSFYETTQCHPLWAPEILLTSTIVEDSVGGVGVDINSEGSDDNSEAYW
jgi:hypothetical protein